ncbi:MAG: substrate-binding domain-containing protein [Propioniciclava sp.]
MKKRIGMALAALTAVALAGCASGAETAPTNTSTSTASGSSGAFEKKDPLTIGYSIFDLQEPYFQAYLAGVQAEADAQGIELLTFDQKSSEQEQVTGSANLINQGISALIVSPVQPDALPATVDAAHAAKIPVVIGDVGAKGDYDVYIESDNIAGGGRAAEYLIDKLADAEGDKTVAIIGNPAGNVAGAARAGGFKEGVAAEGSIELVGEVVGQTIDGAYKAAQDLLAANPDLTAIFCTNSNNVQGATRAAETAGRDDLIVIGFNGDPVELDLIADGKQTATVAQDPYGQGRAAVVASLDLLDGKQVEFADASTRTILFATEIVDADNLEAYQKKLAER